MVTDLEDATQRGLADLKPGPDDDLGQLVRGLHGQSQGPAADGNGAVAKPSLQPDELFNTLTRHLPKSRPTL